jgi:hypothetical protein
MVVVSENHKFFRLFQEEDLDQSDWDASERSEARKWLRTVSFYVEENTAMNGTNLLTKATVNAGYVGAHGNWQR